MYESFVWMQLLSCIQQLCWNMKTRVCKVKAWWSWMTTLISISSKHSPVLWGHLVWVPRCKERFMHNLPLTPVDEKTEAYRRRKNTSRCTNRTPHLKHSGGWSLQVLMYTWNYFWRRGNGTIQIMMFYLKVTQILPEWASLYLQD